MTALFTVDQSGKPAGILDRARRDLDAGTITADCPDSHSTYKWEFTSYPLGTAPVINSPTASTTTITLTEAGGYLLRQTVDEGLDTEDVSERYYGIKWNGFDLPALNETNQDNSQAPYTGEGGTYDKLDALYKAMSAGEGDRKHAVIAYVICTDAPPTEVLGDRYLLDDSGTPHGGWDGASALDIVQFNGATWDAETPEEGWVVYVDALDADALYVNDGTPSWEFRPSGTYNLDEGYNQFGSSSAYVVIDGAEGQGDLSFKPTGAYSFLVDTSACTGTSDGFLVEDGTDYFRLLHTGSNSVDLNTQLNEVDIDVAGDFDVLASNQLLLVGIQQVDVSSGVTGTSDANSTFKSAAGNTGYTAYTVISALEGGSASASDGAVVEVYSEILSGSGKSYLWLGSAEGPYTTDETYLYGNDLVTVSSYAGDLTLETASSGDINLTSTDAFNISGAEDSTISVTGNKTLTISCIGADRDEDALSIYTDTDGGLLLKSVENLHIESEGGNIKIGDNTGSGGAYPTQVVLGAAASSTAVNVYTGGIFDVDVGDAVSIDAVAASNFTVDGANLTLSTTTSGSIFIQSAAAVNLTGSSSDCGIAIDNGSLTLSTSTSGNVLLAAATEARFDDGYRSGWTQTYITLSDSSADWTGYKAAYGEVGLMNALVQASTGGWTATADEAITAGQAICGAVATNDRVNVANADSAAATARNYCIGFAITGAAGAGDIIRVAKEGLVTVICPTGESWSRGDIIYLNEVSGEVSRTPPSDTDDIVQIVGVSAETNSTGTSRTMFVMIGDPSTVV